MGATEQNRLEVTGRLAGRDSLHFKDDIKIKPFKFLENRVRRSYTGGSAIDCMRGLPEPQDGEYLEEWIASCVKATGRDGDPADTGKPPKTLDRLANS